ncbi:rho GTPase-activating protein 4 isoform X1 [Setaria viridis]|uniref:rho GTPase-activating protein 4 isoform X1 n=1 Tax=Setaria viridis TaxID=4556 RepID=UPI0014933B30|nr:rho GTPase-activating protein 5-like isoform X1 [Setaria viridis]
MTEVALLRGPTNLASPASRASASSSLRYLANADSDVLPGSGSPEHPVGSTGSRRLQERRGQEAAGGSEEEEEEERWSFLALLFELLRKSLLGCRTVGGGGEGERGGCGMEIGLPTDVQHVAHVTFDRFHGFLGLPVEFEPEVPRRAPSASASVFGVSTESMQCSYDSRGNSVPTILLMMQRRLYEQGGLRAEGIFRINAENSQEEFVRDQLNSGIVPDGIDVHCLAGLIKAWFREMPSGVLDSIPPEQVMQCQSEEDCARVARCLPPAEAALLDWAVNLMADVVQEEQINKMNDRNIAMVFAPNMTQVMHCGNIIANEQYIPDGYSCYCSTFTMQMADPLTALMYAVQVMNFLKMLVQKTLKDRGESNPEDVLLSQKDPSDENGHQKPSVTLDSLLEEGSRRPSFANEEPLLNSPAHSTGDKPNETNTTEGVTAAFSAQASEVVRSMEDSTSCSQPAIASPAADASSATATNSLQGKASRSPNRRRARKGKGQSGTRTTAAAEKSKGVSIVSRINSKVERIEAWR